MKGAPQCTGASVASGVSTSWIPVRGRRDVLRARDPESRLRLVVPSREEEEDRGRVWCEVVGADGCRGTRGTK